MKTRYEVMHLREWMFIAGRMAAQRKACGITQEDMADWLEVTQATVSRWEAGDVTMPGWAVAAYLRRLPLTSRQKSGIFEG